MKPLAPTTPRPAGRCGPRRRSAGYLSCGGESNKIHHVRARAGTKRRSTEEAQEGEGRGRGPGRPGGRALLPAAQSHSRETLPKRRGRKRHKGGDPAGLSEGRTVHAEEPRPRPGDAFDSEPSPRQRVGARRTRGASGHPAGRAPPGRDPPPTPSRNKGQEGPRGGGGDASAAQQRSGSGKLPERAERDEVRTHALGAQAQNGRELKIIAVLCHTSLNLSSRKL